jgi:uracil-DNA glycosylase family 4
MKELIQQIKNCKLCAIESNTKNKTIGKGSFDPKYLFIGLNPGKEENEVGVPFIGPSGKLLDKWIEFLGLTKDEYSVVNIIKCFTPDESGLNGDEADNCLPFLLKQIELLNPQYIFTLGAIPTKKLLNMEGITSLAGKHFRKDGIIYFPFPHPSFFLRQGGFGWQEPLGIIKQFIHDEEFQQQSPLKKLELIDPGLINPKLSTHSKQSYIPLHVHTTYSIGDSPLKIPDLARDAKDMGFDTLACTDHGTVTGWFEFQQECEKEDIKPILGVEFYIADNYEEKTKNRYHLVALAKNNEGMHNILKLVDISNRVGYYFKPRITLEDLYKYKEGLVVLTACVEGVIAKRLLHDQKEEAEKVLAKLKEEFGEDVYLELQSHYFPMQAELSPMLVELSEKYSVPLVITTDVHFIKKTDFRIKKALSAIAYNLTIEESKYGTETNYLMETNEILQYPYVTKEIIREAMANTIEIGKKCNSRLEKYADALPLFEMKE